MTGSAKRNASIKFVSQNVRGLKSDVRLNELFSYMVRMSVVAACIQETWRSDVGVIVEWTMSALAGRFAIGNAGWQARISRRGYCIERRWS